MVRKSSCVFTFVVIFGLFPHCKIAVAWSLCSWLPAIAFLLCVCCRLCSVFFLVPVIVMLNLLRHRALDKSTSLYWYACLEVFVFVCLTFACFLLVLYWLMSGLRCSASVLRVLIGLVTTYVFLVSNITYQCHGWADAFFRLNFYVNFCSWRSISLAIFLCVWTIDSNSTSLSPNQPAI